MTVSEELAEERIERFERSMTRSKWKLENQDLSQESVSRVHNSIGRDEEKIGLYRLLLGDVAAATEHLEEATRRYALKYEHKRTYEAEENDQATWQTQRSILERLTYAALLSRNDASVEEAAAKVDDLDAYRRQFPRMVHKYHFTTALARVAADADDQRERVDAFGDSLADVKPDHQPYFGNLATILDGIVSGDEATVRDGLEAYLDDYDEDRNDDPESLSDRVSKRATALYLLAKRRGVDVEIESRYIPDCLRSVGQ
ncbi:hypothetical protein [Halomicrococcus gelatinilyticus]|uniref:hypothetical protein n=1 Tax=Halomicrococcus gelatinilyticus TaxID=1702103 RepID=UPI002E158F42